MSIALLIVCPVAYCSHCIVCIIICSNFRQFCVELQLSVFFGNYLFTKLHITNYGKLFAYIHVQSRNKVSVLEKVKIVFVF